MANAPNSSPRYYLGIDGGGTTTRALIATEDGSTWGYGEAGGSNPRDRGIHQAVQELRTATLNAWAGAQIDPSSFAGAFFGIGGAGTLGTEQRAELTAWLPRLPDAAIEVDHDIRIALAGGLSGAPGIVVIAGTGSSGYARNREGQSAQSGGWGPLIDDAGGGYWLGLRALSAVARAHDGRGLVTQLREATLGSLGCTEARQILDWLRQPGVGRPEIANLAKAVLECASNGDEVAARLLREGAHELVLIAGALSKTIFRGEPADVLFTGGLSQSSEYRKAFVDALTSNVPSLRLQTQAHAPVVGAVMLAFEGSQKRPVKDWLMKADAVVAPRSARPS